MKPLRIAIMGTRGIPANYGGFETFAEELAVRLSERGHDVAVYCRDYNMPELAATYRGVRLIHLPTIRHKYLDTIAHTFLSACDASLRQFDVILLCNAANSLFIPIMRRPFTPVAINLDGIERKRKKWNSLGRLWYRMGEFLATKFANRLVADAQVIADYYRERHGAESSVIAYGADVTPVAESNLLAELGLERDEYVLFVSRLEPENNAHQVIEAFEKIETSKKLAIVGDAPYSADYIARLKSTSDPRVVFTGGVYGPGYRQLQRHAYCYVQATEVGGTHPALLEAMGAGNCVIANGTPENREVVAEAGLIYEQNDVESLREKLERALDDADLAARLGAQATARIAKVYNWERITDQYERLFVEMRGSEN